MNSDVVKKGQLYEGSDLEVEYRSRKKEHLEQSIGKGDAVPRGWLVKREFKTKVRIKKEKSPGVQLEDMVWTLLYDIGAEKISSRDFTLVLKTRGDHAKTKQIDALAVDDNIAFVVECKSKEAMGSKSLTQDIAEMADNMTSIQNAAKQLLGEKNLKFAFVFATQNITWDPNDRLDAEEHGIFIWDECDLIALQELATLAGEGAKYQIYNRIFFNRGIKDFKVRIPALKGKMGGRPYYSMVLSPEHLLRLAFVHRRMGGSSFLDVADSYQRIIKKSRIRHIEEFIQNGGFFPGSIIVNFVRPVQEDALCTKDQLKALGRAAKPVVLTLPPYYGCAWIIDGQHRLYGYADTGEKASETLPVTAFVDETAHLQAKMFVDINKNQKSVEADLLWDLYEDLYADSEDEREQELHAISMVAKKLNSATWSPFKGHIEIPKEQNAGNITLTTVCRSISQQKLISPAENDLLFRRSYEETIDFAATRIASFFDAIREDMLDDWDAGDRHYVCTNAGVVVLMGILRDMVECSLRHQEKENLDKFRAQSKKFLEPLVLHLLDADTETIRRYRSAGGASQKSREVRAELTRVIQDGNPGFRSYWLEKYEESLREGSKYVRKKQYVRQYLDADEDERLEFKGSVRLDMKRFLLGDGKLAPSDDLVLEVLQAIVGFLNNKGGDVLIGVLERSHFEVADEERMVDFVPHQDKLVCGIDLEYGKHGWDEYQRRILNLIESHIGAGVLDAGLVSPPAKLSFQKKDLCLISVEPSEAKQYLDNHFYVRRGNKTVLLEGADIDKYRASRRA